jgi:hypothetical protein
MELLASRDGKEIWFEQLMRPFSFSSPFGGAEYVCILFANDQLITNAEQNHVSTALVQTGCKYAICSGHKCSSWDDSIDWAHLTMYKFNPPEDEHIMTTWHETETVEQVLFFGLNNTDFDMHDFDRYLVLFVGEKAGLRDEIEKTIQSQWMRFAG